MTDTRQQRNEVFGASNNNLPTQPPPNDIPVADVPLPSGGIIYPKDTPLHMAETITIRAMTAMDEDILVSQSYAKKGTNITELIKACVMDKKINVRDMISGDRNAIMVALRITGYGSEYIVEVSCPKCDNKQEVTFDLANMPIKKLEIEPTNVGENAFDVILPVSGKQAQVRFLNGADEEDIMVTMDRKKKKGFEQTDLITSRLLYSIVSIDGKVDKMEISRHIRTMPAGDSHFIRKFLNKNEPSIELKGDFECKSCDTLEVIDLPITAEFFWPR